jgi:transposase
VDVIEGLDLRAMSGSYRGSGSASYHPRMLLGILVYGYAMFSSRKLERVASSNKPPLPLMNFWSFVIVGVLAKH